MKFCLKKKVFQWTPSTLITLCRLFSFLKSCGGTLQLGIFERDVTTSNLSFQGNTSQLEVILKNGIGKKSQTCYSRGPVLWRSLVFAHSVICRPQRGLCWLISPLTIGQLWNRLSHILGCQWLTAQPQPLLGGFCPFCLFVFMVYSSNADFYGNESSNSSWLHV